MTRATLASIVQNSAGQVQAGEERHHRPDSTRQLSRFLGGYRFQ